MSDAKLKKIVNYRYRCIKVRKVREKKRIVPCDIFLRKINQKTMVKLQEMNFKISSESRICRKCQSFVNSCKRYEKEFKYVPAVKEEVIQEQEEEEKASVNIRASPTCFIENSDYEGKSFMLNETNKFFDLIGCSPILKSKLHCLNYREEKSKKVAKNLLQVEHKSITIEESKKIEWFDEIIEQLKNKFKNTSDMKEKLQILTLLPYSWSTKQIQDEFDISLHFAQKSKELQQEKGVLSMPNAKVGRKIEENILDQAKNFFELDRISKTMPGIKDYKSIKMSDGKRQKIQKRMLVHTLKEVFDEFKIQYPNSKIGFTKFQSLRPEHCVFVGESGTHTGCVCINHENPKLFLMALDTSSFTIKTTTECIRKIICDYPNERCYLRECEACKNTMALSQILDEYMNTHKIEYLEYKEWVNVNKMCNLVSRKVTANNFIETFCKNIDSLATHTYIASEQYKYVVAKKNNLKPGELLVQMDFAENFSFIVQNAVQSYHWSNQQSTIHPIVIYYKNNLDKIENLNFVIISEVLNHDATAVHIFITLMMQFAFEKIGILKHITFCTDGAGSQYKNRFNFLNMCYLKEEYGTDTEWVFFASGHGKGPCDGVGGIVKRLARDESLRKGYQNTINSPKTLFEWLKTKSTAINVAYVNQLNYDDEKKKLANRYDRDKPLAIKGTRSFHSFIPIGDFNILVKRTSNSNSSQVFKII